MRLNVHSARVEAEPRQRRAEFAQTRPLLLAAAVVGPSVGLGVFNLNAGKVA